MTQFILHNPENRDSPASSISSIMSSVAFSNPMNPAYYPDTSYPVYNGYGIGPNYLSRKEISGYQSSNYRNTSINFSLNYNTPFLPGLSAKAFINYTTYDTRSKNFYKDYSYYNYDPTSNKYTEVVLSDVSGISLYENYDRGNKTTYNFSLNYDKAFGKNKISAFLLNEIIDYNGSYVSAGRQDFISSAIDQIFASSAEKQSTSGYESQDSRLSFVGRFNYSFDERYLLEFTFREDASPRFAKNKRWGFFPSVSAGWRLSEEKFLKNISSIDNLKLRASFGETGYDNIGNYNFLTGYNFSSTYVIDGKATVGIKTKGLSNPNATWEKMKIFNGGVDYSFLNRLIWGNVDGFYRLRKDMLGTRVQSLPSTFGATLPEENINSQTSRGFELVIGHDNSIGKVNYSISANVSYARAKWKHYDEPEYVDAETKARYIKSGQWVNRYFGLQSLGLFTSQEEINNWADQDGDLGNGINTNLQPGDVKYLDYNNDGIINDLDYHAIGKNNIPETFFGLDARVSYKGFDFSMLWQGATGYNVYFQKEAQQPFFNNAIPLAMFLDRWTPDNNDANARFPRTVSNIGSTNNYLTSSFWLQDGTYLRLKNITLGYTLPVTLTRKAKIDMVRFLVTGINLLTFTGISPYDPETGDDGSQGRGWDYPQQRTFMFGVNLTF